MLNCAYAFRNHEMANRLKRDPASVGVPSPKLFLYAYIVRFKPDRQTDCCTLVANEKIPPKQIMKTFSIIIIIITICISFNFIMLFFI